MGTTWDNAMISIMNHAPGTGSIAQAINQQSKCATTVPGMPPWMMVTSKEKLN